ncbi:hypothetical protein KBZ20_14720 [Vulcanococcus limneticus Candia 3F8]|uniref:hypothetical protein n=1 Tax=Vulcanococcus limneticus TaxID=2170428 RepID=UPI0012FF70B2|nr:hypothetical protein [Vulcanococcus limneticus]MCP9793063.1 hypothetical protein [Vulcanococcus limneticus MW73D5]MCP9895026.1 hypothetical protein [Vulcanococcus limneticus Candia 3F8]MCP9898474.1 hypothetical protein [Vulcanococcus limneticus Candia 3B3]
MLRIRLPAPRVQLELIAPGRGQRQPFQVLGPSTEVAFVEELLEQQFGSLTINPTELLKFLSTDPWVREQFSEPQLVEGNLAVSEQQESTFHRKTLGDKLVQVGVIDAAELDRLLEDYRPFSGSQRFGEFLKLNLQIPPALLDLLLNPALFDEAGFNDKRLGERLVEIGVISEEQLREALAAQKAGGGLLGEVMAAKGHISDVTARFFSKARISGDGQIEFTPH